MMDKTVAEMLDKFRRWQPKSLESLADATGRLQVAVANAIGESKVSPKTRKLAKTLYRKVLTSHNGVSNEYYLVYGVSIKKDLLRLDTIKYCKYNRVGNDCLRYETLEFDLNQVCFHGRHEVTWFNAPYGSGLPSRYQVATGELAAEVLGRVKDFVLALHQDVLESAWCTGKKH